MGHLHCGHQNAAGADMTQILTFEQARALVEEGDLIGVRSKDGLVSALTRFFTRDVYTHTGIVR